MVAIIFHLLTIVDIALGAIIQFSAATHATKQSKHASVFNTFLNRHFPLCENDNPDDQLADHIQGSFEKTMESWSASL